MKLLKLMLVTGCMLVSSHAFSEEKMDVSEGAEAEVPVMEEMEAPVAEAEKDMTETIDKKVEETKEVISEETEPKT